MFANVWKNPVLAQLKWKVHKHIHAESNEMVELLILYSWSYISLSGET